MYLYERNAADEYPPFIPNTGIIPAGYTNTAPGIFIVFIRVFMSSHQDGCNILLL